MSFLNVIFILHNYGCLQCQQQGGHSALVVIVIYFFLDQVVDREYLRWSGIAVDKEGATDKQSIEGKTDS